MLLASYEVKLAATSYFFKTQKQKMLAPMRNGKLFRRLMLLFLMSRSTVGLQIVK